ncbi:ATP-binding cassette domain-containing protein [Prevotella sp. P6B4]|uniref:ATP-binding cassette domain-containing protein n=1 Tax=Prevotella sp. P6B4 TaxID=1410614 RepID=UPI00048E947F|nr:ATP-binding cassette domain-containing protein [Prevotella sp. P6B4]
MTDIILSSFLSLFALFGKEEQVDEVWAKTMLTNYLRRHLGIRNTTAYLDLYTDIRGAYEISDNLDTTETVKSICSNLHGKITIKEESLLLLRLMEFCADDGVLLQAIGMFKTMAKIFKISDKLYQDFSDFVENRENSQVMVHHLDDTDGELKTLACPSLGLLLFTYTGKDTVLCNDVPVLSGAFQVWLQSSVIKGKSGKPIYFSTIVDKYTARNNETQDVISKIEFCGRDINFRFPNSDNGMHNLSFTLHHGELLAIMGGSGTGKSTLLSILNGSLVPQEGTITINGHSITEPRVKNLIGFVPQDDLLIEELTVYQNLWFTAKLCFEGMSEEEIENRVMKTLKDLGLDAAKDLKVGSAINKYISGGQRKRLNIALELIREPAVLFLDEPTSGLSSADTEKVINLLKEQTYKGKLIVVNIHQPSSDVYKLFDRLWLLDKGGYPVFDGNPIDAITYFKNAANYADATTSACPTCGNVNPEIVLNIIDEKALNSSGEVSDERKMSPQEWHELYLKNRPKQKALKHGNIPPSDQKKPSAFKQFLIFLRRNIRTKITNLQYLCITLLEAPLLAVVCALLTRFAPSEGYSVMDNKNLVSYFFMSVIVATFIGMSGSAEEIIKDRALLKRERFLSLSHSSYIWSKIVYMAVVSLLQTFLFIAIGNSIMGLHGLFDIWWLILFVTSLLSNLTGLLLSQCLSSVVAIYISIPLLLIPQILLCGLVVSFSDLTPKSTTGNVPAIGNIIPSRWAYEALAVTSYTDNAYEKPFFDLHKVKYETQFYNMGYLYELQSQLETMNDEVIRGKEVNPTHLEIIKTNLPLLTSVSGKESYSGDYSYASLKEYLASIETELSKRSNKATLAADSKMSELIREHGRENVLNIKRDNYNIRLEEFVVGADNARMLDVVNHVIVPRTSIIFLTPRSHFGCAPFYSSEKIVGSWHIKTLWFNLSVMLLMCFVVALFLFTDWPGRYIRKSEQ